MSRRLKVALLSYRDDWHSGGSLRVAQLLSEHLPREEIEAHLVFAYGGPGPVTAQSTINIHHLNATSARDWRNYRSIRRWFREQDFDIIHFVDAIHWLYFLLLGLRARRVMHFHGTPDLSTMARFDQLLGISKRWLSDAGIVITHGAKHGIARLGWMSPSQLHVIQNGVSTDIFRNLPAQAEARVQLGIPASARVMGAVARFNDGCGLMEVFDILKLLPEEWHVLLVGDGRIRSDLERRATQQNVRHRLHLPGMMADIRPAYVAMDVVVMLARYQSFCLMLAEAMLARRPIVGLQGAGEYTEWQYPLITNANAILFPREKPWDAFHQEPATSYQAVAQALQDIISDTGLSTTMTTAAYDWVTTRFSARLQAERCHALYRKLVP